MQYKTIAIPSTLQTLNTTPNFVHLSTVGVALILEYNKLQLRETILVKNVNNEVRLVVHGSV